MTTGIITTLLIDNQLIVSLAIGTSRPVFGKKSSAAASR